MRYNIALTIKRSSVSYTFALGVYAPHWKGPQRLILTVDQDVVRDVGYTDGYNARGCAERLARMPLDSAVQLVARISSVASHAHTFAFCSALEAMWGVAVPARAQCLRCALAELERLTLHLSTLAELTAALGAQPRSTQISECYRTARRATHALSGRAIMPDLCVPGGVRRDVPDEQRKQALVLLEGLQRQFFPLVDQLVDQPTLLARTVNLGILSREVAERFQLRGPVARAAGIGMDLRRDTPYAAYPQLEVRSVTQDGGDTHARLVVLLLEALESIRLTSLALQIMPDGEIRTLPPRDIPATQTSAAVESPRGALRYTVQGDGQRLSSVTIAAPRTLDRLLARTLLTGLHLDNVIPVLISVQADAADAEG